jgi:chromosome segregation ATPase
VFDGLRDRLERLREAFLEAKVGADRLRDGLAATERELEHERTQLRDAERRGRLAAQIPDAETVAVAQRFAAKHRERVTILERKLAVQRDELSLVEREVEEMRHELKRSGRAEPKPGAPDPTDPLARDADRRLMQETVEQQLAHLKRKMGKQP